VRAFLVSVRLPTADVTEEAHHHCLMCGWLVQPIKGPIIGSGRPLPSSSGAPEARPFPP